MKDEDREEVENMIYSVTLKVEEDLRSEYQDEIRRLEIEIDDLRGEQSNG